MNLSPQQTEAFDAIMKWHRTAGDKYFVLAGYAGTGKTTLAKYIANAVGAENVIFCSYTGKAANVLREKGCANSGTIHSFLYKLISEEDGKPVFDLDPHSQMRRASLVIVDEWSMLNQEIISDIHSTAKKVLYLGDPFQLPPVSGKSLLEPNHMITEIHRQALDSPIIRAATKVRNGEALAYCDEGEFVFRNKSGTDVQLWLEADQTIVGTNNTRRDWNNRFRGLLGFKPEDGALAQAGEKIICLKNNRKSGLFNGMIGTCKYSGFDEKGHYRLSFKTDDLEFNRLSVWRGHMEGHTPNAATPKFIDWFDFGYAVTCHKSQGSEFDNVLVYNEPVGREPIDRQKWLYTGISRAKKKCVLIDPPR